MSKNRILSLTITVATLLLPAISFASTGSDELSPVLSFLQDNLNGIVGKIIVITAALIALFNIAVKFNAYVIAGCVGTALFALYADNFLIAMFGAVI